VNQLRRFLVAPVFEDEKTTRTARLLNTLLLVFLVVIAMGCVASASFPRPGLALAFMGLAAVLDLGALLLTRRGRVRAAGLLLSSAMWALVTTAAFISAGLSGVAIFGLIVVTVIAGLLLGGRGGFLFSGLSVVAGLGMLWAEGSGRLPPPLVPGSSFSTWVGLSMYVTVAATVLHIATSSINRALERVQRSNRELQAIRVSLEERVMERTHELQESAAELALRSQELEAVNLELEESRRRQEAINRELVEANERTHRRAAQLQAITEVGQAIAQVRDLTRLLPQVTQLISQRFGFYHVGIFLVDEAGRYAVLRAANSEGGQQMLARGHKLAVGEQGIVGHATATGKPRVVPDVGAGAAYFATPDLPETRSEMALPLQVGGQVIGALDVQSKETEAFGDQDLAVLSALADQVAIAIQNARLFQQSRQALAEAEEAEQRYLLQAWQEFLKRRSDSQVEYTLEGVSSALAVELPTTQQAMMQGQLVTMSEMEGDGNSDGVARAVLSVPIKLRGQVIGVIDLHEVDEARTWTEQETSLAQAVADQMAQALEMARLFEQIRARARREALTRQITERIRDAMDVDTMLQTAIQELGQALGASKVYVRLATDASTGGRQ